MPVDVPASVAPANAAGATEGGGDAPAGSVADAHDVVAERLVALCVHLGIATPYGAVGVSLDVVPVSWLGLEAGVGTNFDSAEFAFMPRLRIAPGKQMTTHFTLGAGVSYLRRYYGHEQNGLTGFMRVFESMAEGRIQLTLWQPAYFANLELGGESRRGHVVARGYLGFTHLINASQYSCTAGDFACTPSAATNLVYLGGSLGYAF